MLAITLEGELEAQITALAIESGQSANDFVRGVVARYLEEIGEDQQDAIDALAALEEHRRNPGVPFTLEDAMQRYGVQREELAP